MVSIIAKMIRTKKTYTEDGRVRMQRWALLRLVHREILDLARTEDDVLIRVRYRRDKLRRRSVGEDERISARRKMVRKHRAEMETGIQGRVTRKATEASTRVVLRSHIDRAVARTSVLSSS